MAIEIVSQNDCLVVDSRLIALELGIEHRALMQTIKKYLTEIQEFGQVIFETREFKTTQGNTSKKTYCYLNEAQAQIIISKSRNGLNPNAIDKFKSLGFDFSMFPCLERKRSKTKESDYSNALAKELNGKREVRTLAGNIDVLASSQIIEVKEIKFWKAALGQVLVYGHYYPSHQKRIHLYGETQESFLEMINSHCAKFNVTVTWEP